MARWSLILARLCVSSTVIRTCRSSLRCSQLGFPRFISSCNTKPFWKLSLNTAHKLGPLLQAGNRISLLLLFGSIFGSVSNYGQNSRSHPQLWKHYQTHEATVLPLGAHTSLVSHFFKSAALSSSPPSSPKCHTVLFFIFLSLKPLSQLVPTCQIIDIQMLMQWCSFIKTYQGLIVDERMHSDLSSRREAEA